MTQNDYTTSFVVNKTPAEVYDAINDVRGWWTGKIEGSTDELGAEFTYSYEDLHESTQKITELVPGSKIVWHVTDATISFVEDKKEWEGTDIVFALSPKSDQTEVRFTHVGLKPQIECYENCSDAWGYYINTSLRTFIEKGAA